MAGEVAGATDLKTTAETTASLVLLNYSGGGGGTEEVNYQSEIWFD